MAIQDQLTQAAQALGRIETEPGREGGEDRYYTSTGVYAEKVGPNRYRVPVLGNVDADGKPGRGAFMAEVDGSGNVVRQPYYQKTTNQDWSGLAAFILTAAGGMIASAYAGPGASAWTSGYDLAGGGSLSGWGAAPISASDIAALGSAATPTDLANAVTQMLNGGTAPSGILNALKNIPSSIVKGALSLLPQNVQDGLKNVANTLTGNGTGDFSNLANLIGAGVAANDLIGASNTAAADYNTLGNDQANEFYGLFSNIDNRTQGIGNTLNDRYKQLGTDASGMLGNLATQAKGDYNALGTAAAGTYNNVASGNKSAYDNLLTDIKSNSEKFTPWNVTTNVGTTNKGLFTPTVGTQNVSDQATAAAGSSFGAANAIDVNNLAQQKFGQQQAMLAPYDAKALAELRANLAATGRTGVASNATGQAISPELAAYYLSKGTRDQGLLTNADQAALNVRQGLVGQGVAASGVPLNIGAHGLSQIGTGVSAGAQQASTNNSLASTIANLGSRGIDTTTNAQLHGADQTLPIFQNAVSVPLGLQKEGIGTMLSQGNRGLEALTGQLDKGTEAAAQLGSRAINARGTQYAQSIATRYQGRKDKAALLARLFQQIGAMTTPAQRQAVNNAAANGDVVSLTRELINAGMSPDQVTQVITGGTGGGDLGSGTYSIWSPDGSPDMGGGSGAGETTFGSMFGFY